MMCLSVNLGPSHWALLLSHTDSCSIDEINNIEPKEEAFVRQLKLIMNNP